MTVTDVTFFDFIHHHMHWWIFFLADIADTIGYLLMGSSEQASQEIEVKIEVKINL